MNQKTKQGNEELVLAADFVEQTGCNIFLTGKAGTGKTTFLKNLHNSTAKRFIVTAPTGVAAINAGGVTLHSFFQLPFGPNIPGQDLLGSGGRRRFRYSKEKKAIIASLDLLVIDEISMVRADLLDAVDTLLRRLRRSEQPFGGVQLLMIGDLFQLPPVVKQDEWQLLREYYDSFYFFSSQALSKTEFVTIELKHIYRQSDSEFIRILNQVREGRIDAAAINTLNLRCQPEFFPRDGDGYITLTTHNNSAEAVNKKHLTNLPGTEQVLSAQVTGDFPESNFPAPDHLALKKGAQVMFVKNDLSYEKRFYNGKIGRVARIHGSAVEVMCPGDDNAIIVEPAKWENIKYTVNPETKEIEEEVIGSFSQYPLKPAWAITIHKSQGLTFEKAIIDTQAAFAHGQTYVALSRCKSLSGLVLRSPFTSQMVSTDGKVLQFSRSASEVSLDQQVLKKYQKQYQQNLLLQCFDFNGLEKRFFAWIHIVRKNRRNLHLEPDIDNLEEMSTLAEQDVFRVSENFRRQLLGIFADSGLPESDVRVLERLTKASVWFGEKIGMIFRPFTMMSFETDNKEVAKRLSRALEELQKELAVKCAGIGALGQGFSVSDYVRICAQAELSGFDQKGVKPRQPTYTESDIAHPELFQTLKAWRADMAVSKNIAHYQVMHQRVLIQLVVCLPQSLSELQAIAGIGPKTMEKYGEDIISFVGAYRKKYNIQTVERPEPVVVVAKDLPSKKGGKPRTAEVSLALFEGGKGVSEIAHLRGLAPSTIESHLCLCIEEGALSLYEVLNQGQQKEIEAALDDLNTISLSEIKKKLGDSYSYGQIKMVIAHRNYLSATKDL